MSFFASLSHAQSPRTEDQDDDEEDDEDDEDDEDVAVVVSV